MTLTFEQLKRLWYPEKEDVPLRPNWVVGAAEVRLSDGEPPLRMQMAFWVDRTPIWVSGRGFDGDECLRNCLEQCEEKYYNWCKRVGNPIFYTQQERQDFDKDAYWPNGLGSPPIAP